MERQVIVESEVAILNSHHPPEKHVHDQQHRQPVVKARVGGIRVVPVQSEQCQSDQDHDDENGGEMRQAEQSEWGSHGIIEIMDFTQSNGNIIRVSSFKLQVSSCWF